MRFVQESSHHGCALKVLVRLVRLGRRELQEGVE
jgi:hypothetical protein